MHVIENKKISLKVNILRTQLTTKLTNADERNMLLKILFRRYKWIF